MNSSKELAAAAHIGSGVRGAMQIFGLFQWSRKDNSTFYDVFVNHMEIPVVDQARWMKILLANLFIFTNILVDIKTLHQLVTILRKRLSREEQVAPTSLTNVEMCEELYHVIMSFDTASQTLPRSNDIRPLIVLSEKRQIIERIREVYEMK
ncbi:hypothetical protein Ddc_06496 [Ditylenchus destructor]|nr:hypothetical protein Ddc_06496 [Ditylenchus destructor]